MTSSRHFSLENVVPQSGCELRFEERPGKFGAGSYALLGMLRKDRLTRKRDLHGLSRSSLPRALYRGTLGRRPVAFPVLHGSAPQTRGLRLAD